MHANAVLPDAFPFFVVAQKKELPSEGTKRKAEPDGVPATKRKKSTANEAAAEEVSVLHSGSYLRCSRHGFFGRFAAFGGCA